MPGRTTVWRTALITGLLTSTFSTLFIVLGSGRIGRDVPLSWMEVGTIVLRDGGVRTSPGLSEIVAGILVHQSADIAWALIFFGLLARWTWRLRPAQLLAIAPLWALMTSVIEYFLILPGLQPLLRMQTPYWINLLVHVASGLAYPLFYVVRQRIAAREMPYAGFGRRWGTRVLGGVLGVLVVLATLGAIDREVPWPFVTAEGRTIDQAFLRRMTAHHEVGIHLAQLAAERAEREELRTLGRMMVAEQRAENEHQRRWWRSWFSGELPPPTSEEMATMPGMPPPGAVEALAELSGPAFEKGFLELMIPHHQGAIQMSNEVWLSSDDPHLRLLADQIRHAQGAQITRMHALESDTTVSWAQRL